VAVGLFNRGDQPTKFSFRWDSLHLGVNLGGKTLEARDFWKHEEINPKGASFTATVPKHGVVLLKVAAMPQR